MGSSDGGWAQTSTRRVNGREQAGSSEEIWVEISTFLFTSGVLADSEKTLLLSVKSLVNRGSYLIER